MFDILNPKRRKRELAIATEVVIELYQALRPAIEAAGPSADGLKLMQDNNWMLADIFGRACERHQLAEAAARRVYSEIPAALSDLVKTGEELAEATRLPDYLRP